jgi:hypothetical protein
MGHSHGVSATGNAGRMVSHFERFATPCQNR